MELSNWGDPKCNGRVAQILFETIMKSYLSLRGLLRVRRLQTSHLFPITGIKTAAFVHLEPPAAEAGFTLG